MTATPTLIRNLFLHPAPPTRPSKRRRRSGCRSRMSKGGWRLGSWKVKRTKSGIVLPWAELVAIAMGFWEQEEVEAALGADVAEAIPELLRLCDLEVRIPRIEVAALEAIAARDGKSVDAVLARELWDLVSAQSEWLGRVIPGFAMALSWPC